MRRSIPALVLLVGLLAMGCGGVRARTRGGDGPRPDVRVVVLDIKNASDEVRDTVIDILAERYEVVDDSAYRHTARELDARTMRTKHVAKVTRELDIDAVAYGVLVKRGKKKFALRLTVREGESGKKLARFTLPVEKGRIKRSKLSKRLYAALDRVAPDPEEPMPEPEGLDEPEPAAEPAPPREPVRVAEKKPAPPPKREAKPADDDEGDDELDEESLSRAMAKKPEKVARAEKPKAEPKPARKAEPKPAPKKVAAAAPKKGGAKAGKGDAAVDEDELDSVPLPKVEVDEDGQVLDDENPL